MTDKMRFQIRRATGRDVDEIFRLTNAMAAGGLMLTRSKYKILTMLSSFLVVVDTTNGRVAGCGAFSPLWTDMGEVMALAVAEEYQRQGLGKLLVDALIEEGRRMEMDQIITLTYQVDFFRRMGFEITDKDEFPRKLWRECLECPKLECCDETAMIYRG